MNDYRIATAWMSAFGGNLGSAGGASLDITLRTRNRISRRIPEDNAPGSDTYHGRAHIGRNGLSTIGKRQAPPPNRTAPCPYPRFPSPLIRACHPWRPRPGWRVGARGEGLWCGGLALALGWGCRSSLAMSRYPYSLFAPAPSGVAVVSSEAKYSSNKRWTKM